MHLQKYRLPKATVRLTRAPDNTAKSAMPFPHLHLLRVAATVALKAALALTFTALIVQTALAGDDHRHWEFGLVLDTAYSGKTMELGYRDRNLQLGHGDIMISGPLGRGLYLEAIVSGHTADGRLFTHTERLLLTHERQDSGFSLGLGRFASQVGAINAQHPHEDDFSERPLLYRGFLGNHWFDDGLRLNWLAPTPFYLRLGAEAFSGRQLIEQSQATPVVGAGTLSIKTGADIDPTRSWAFGVSVLNNFRQAAPHDHVASSSTQSHLHGASFSGRQLWMSDLTLRWSPQGRPEEQELKLTWEYASARRIHPDAGALMHTASALAAVWRFRRNWEMGAKADWLRVHQPSLHDDDSNPATAATLEFGAAQLREKALMIAYRPDHGRTLRLQYSRQQARGPDVADVFPHPVREVLMLQLVLGFGSARHHHHD
ncbi:MAG: hypothetical protein EBU74_07785 [Betaproteobacteria bacterium]|jgi:hypothetical protein|nr:hypothetical protein [Betaproteobacteria bacterium]